MNGTRYKRAPAKGILDLFVSNNAVDPPFLIPLNTGSMAHGVTEGTMYHTTNQCNDPETFLLYLMHNQRLNNIGIYELDQNFIDLIGISAPTGGGDDGGGIPPGGINVFNPTISVNYTAVDIRELSDNAVIKKVTLTNIYSPSITKTKDDVYDTQSEIDINDLPSGGYGIRVESADGDVYIKNHYIP